MKWVFQFLIFLFLIQNKSNANCRYCYFWGPNAQAFYDEFQSCILRLPGPIEFLGPCDRSDRNNCYTHEALAEHAEEYYFTDHFPSYSVVGITRLFNRLRKDLNNEYLRIINLENKIINELLSGKKKCTWKNDAGEEQCLPYAHKKIAKVQQAQIDAKPIIDATEEFFFQQLEVDIAECLEDGFGLHTPSRRASTANLLFDKGFLNFRIGEFENSLENIALFFESSKNDPKKNDELEKLKENALLLKGQTELETGLYADAFNL